MGAPCDEIDCMAGYDTKYTDTDVSGHTDDVKSRNCEVCLPDTESTSLMHRHNADYYCNKDLYVQIQTRFVLCDGCFYYSNIGSTEAKTILKPCAVGTFIIRDSSDSKYLYTISVKTKRGPTSIRICYEHGRFSLDSDVKSRSRMPKFSTLLDLVDFYVRKSIGKESEQCRFLDKWGKKDLPIVMSVPKQNDVPSLKHLTRTLVNRCLPATGSSSVRLLIEKLPLPKPLKSYLKDYPYLY